MAARMIRVRNKDTKQEALVSEQGFKHFAGYFERVDEPKSGPRTPASAVESAPPKTPARREDKGDTPK